MAPSILIRPFRMEEYDDVLSLWEDAGLPCHPHGRDAHSRVRVQIDDPHTRFLVAEIGGSLVGTLILTHDTRKGWLNRLAVRPGHRNRGIATALVAEAERHFEAEGIEVIAALIQDTNVDSRRLFSELGYVHDPGVTYYSKRKREDA
jgi:ribosomal protein S18 acetylase RimI-like enzyme